MAIIIQTGDIVASSNVKKGSKYKYFDRSDSFKKIDTYCYDGEFVIVPSEGNLSVQYVNGKFSHHSKTYRISSSSNNIKYIQYYLLKNLNRLVANGSTVQRVNSDQWKELLLSINVTKKEQQEIIDIIAPLENAIIVLDKIIKTKKEMFHLKGTDKTLNEYILNTNTGYSYSKNDYVENGRYKVFTIKNISSSNIFERTNIIKNNMLNCGDTITGMSGTIGTATVISDENLVSNQRTFAFSSDFPVQTAISIELQSQKLINLSTGAVQKNITKDNILNLAFSPLFSKKYDESIILELKIKKLLYKILENTVKLLIK